MSEHASKIGLPGRRDQIKVGSVWRSRDPRDNGRLVTVQSEPSTSSWDRQAYVVVRSVRRSTMRVSTLLDRYDIVKQAPESRAT